MCMCRASRGCDVLSIYLHKHVASAASVLHARCHTHRRIWALLQSSCETSRETKWCSSL